jgi:cellulose synthase/poly-beta-1,6-N-acetylglucosamine synthase-like glycosyltransferase
MTIDPLPAIDIVIIGIHVESYLGDCIASIRAADYPQESLTITYIDGGSRDRSAAIAEAAGIRVIRLDHPCPTPGRGRNAGLFAATAPFVQFLDADTILNRRWFKTAIACFDETIVAVCGKRSERRPDLNVYHRIASVEWFYEQGPCRYFGGDVLTRREPLTTVGGFDESLVAGEEPDLSCRLRQQGWIIWRTAADMTLHELNMTRFSQYWKRAFRSGHAYAQIGLRYLHTPEKLWMRELLRISVMAALPLMIFPSIGLLLGMPLVAVILALIVFLKPLGRIPDTMRRCGMRFPDALIYALHASFIVYPQCCGVIRYLLTPILGPVVNRR